VEVVETPERLRLTSLVAYHYDPMMGGVQPVNTKSRFPRTL